MRSTNCKNQWGGFKAAAALAPSIAQAIGGVATISTNRAHSNGGSREDSDSDGMPIAKDRISTIQFIYHRYRWGKELLCIWESWTFSKVL